MAFGFGLLDILGTDNTGVDDVVVDSKNFVFIRPFDMTSYAKTKIQRKRRPNCLNFVLNSFFSVY